MCWWLNDMLSLSNEITKFEGKDAYYEAAYLIVRESRNFFVAAKTPTLLLPQERESEWRSKYFDIACERVNRGMETVYLFSLPETITELKAITDNNLFSDTMRLWQDFLSLKTFKLGYILHSNFDSLVMGNLHLAKSIKDPISRKSVGVLVYPVEKATNFVEYSQKLIAESTFLDNNFRTKLGI